MKCSALVKGRPCRSYAAGGSIFCSSHNPELEHTGGAPAGNTNALTHGRFSRFADLFTADEAAALADTGTLGEIDLLKRVCKVNLMRALRDDNQLAVVAQVKGMVEVLKAEHHLNGDQTAGLLGAIDKVLEELGVGGD